MNKKLGRPTTLRLAMIKSQVSQLLWYGRIETTVDRAKAVGAEAERILTKAINTFDDFEKKIETRKNKKGQDIKVEVINDGTKKLAARRAIMAKLIEMPELIGEEEKYDAFKARTKNRKHPLVDKIFHELAPKYAKRADELGNKGGYTRVLKLGHRQGDNAEMAIVELV